MENQLHLKKGKFQKGKIRKWITDEQVQEANVTKKWTEQRDFLVAVEAAIAECKYSVDVADIENIMQVIKKYLSENNKNLVMRALVTLEQIVRATGKKISRYASVFAGSVLAAWCDNRANVREQATKTIDAFAVVSGPSPFIRALSSSGFKGNNDSRLETIRWLARYVDEISQADVDRIIPITIQCMEDKASTTRQLALKVACKIREISPDIFTAQLKNLAPASQRTIMACFESPTVAQKTNEAAAAREPSSPVRRSVKQAEKVEEKIVQELPRYASAPTQAKRVKRLKQQQTRLGLSMIANRQMISAVLDKAKTDSQGTLPASITQRLFSSLSMEQIDALHDMRLLRTDDPLLALYCADIFVRWLAVKMFDKNVKTVTEGMAFLGLVFSEGHILLQEMEVIVPLIFWAVDSKPTHVVEASLDLLMVIRTHSDPSEYSTVLRSCLETCSVVSLVHLFSELQFTVTDDGRCSAIFLEIAGYVDHRSIEVVAACGGVLSMLTRRMSEEELLSVVDSLAPEQREAVVAVVPVTTRDASNFESFSGLPSIEKIRTCRRLLDQLRLTPELVLPSADMVLYALHDELLKRETDWIVVKPVLFALHDIIAHCSVKSQDMKQTLRAVMFFANRWQKKVALMEGISQTINAILSKLFEQIAPEQLFLTILEGMAGLKGVIPSHSFYCRCWVAVTNQIDDLIANGDKDSVVAIVGEHLQTFEPTDVRWKLCNALILTLTGAKPTRSKESVEPLPVTKSVTKTPVKSPAKRKTPVKREAPAQPLKSPPTSRPDEKKVTKPTPVVSHTSSVSSAASIPDKAPPVSVPRTTAAAVPIDTKTAPKSQEQIADLKQRLSALQHRLKKA